MPELKCAKCGAPTFNYLCDRCKGGGFSVRKPKKENKK